MCSDLGNINRGVQQQWSCCDVNSVAIVNSVIDSVAVVECTLFEFGGGEIPEVYPSL